MLEIVSVAFCFEAMFEKCQSITKERAQKKHIASAFHLFTLSICFAAHFSTPKLPAYFRNFSLKIQYSIFKWAYKRRNLYHSASFIATPNCEKPIIISSVFVHFTPTEPFCECVYLCASLFGIVYFVRCKSVRVLR